jgi:hypothetical protein
MKEDKRSQGGTFSQGEEVHVFSRGNLCYGGGREQGQRSSAVIVSPQALDDMGEMFDIQYFAGKLGDGIITQGKSKEVHEGISDPVEVSMDGEKRGKFFVEDFLPGGEKGIDVMERKILDDVPGGVGEDVEGEVTPAQETSTEGRREEEVEVACDDEVGQMDRSCHGVDDVFKLLRTAGEDVGTMQGQIGVVQVELFEPGGKELSERDFHGAGEGQKEIEGIVTHEGSGLLYKRL